MKTSTLFLTFFALFLLNSAGATNSNGISGKVESTFQDPVAFANIALYTAADSVLIGGAVSDINGDFIIESKMGEYYIRVSSIGFLNFNSGNFTINAESPSLEFGTIVLIEDINLLDEVTIQSMVPTIVNKPDRMVMNVEGTALSSGSSAYDLLSKAPGVWIDQEGNITLNGKSGVQVMIDNRPTYLSAVELQNMLKGISSENIKDIEIITNPSSKYDAEGTSGILNLNFKKNLQEGMNGSIYGAWEYRNLNGYSGGSNINFKKNRWNSFVNIDMARRTRGRVNTMTREFNDPERNIYFDQKGKQTDISYSPSLRLGTDFDINEKQSIGFTARLAYDESRNKFNTESVLSNNNPPENLLIFAHNNYGSENKTGAFNLHYILNPDTNGTMLSIDVDYVKLERSGKSTFLNEYYSLPAQGLINNEELTSDNPAYYDIYAAKVDFTRTLFGTLKMDAGLKSSYVVSDNNLYFFKIIEGSKEVDHLRTNSFSYREYINAAYANLSRQLGEKWSIQAGLRVEQTQSEGYSQTLDQRTEREYIDFFPSVYVQQKVNDNYSIGYNYSRRIDRPGYHNLNPFIFYLDPYTMAVGNPLLRPQYTNSFELRQTWKRYNLTMDYSKTNDFIAEIPQQDNSNGTTVFSQSNVDNFESIGITLIAPIELNGKWNMNNTFIAANQNYSTILNGRNEKNAEFFYMVQSNQNIQLPAGIKLEVNAGYQGPVAYGLFKISPQWWVDAGLKKSFIEDKLDVSFRVSDIFKSRRVIGAANLNGNVNEFDQYFYQQSFSVSARYKFNKGDKFDIKRRNTNFDELNRANG